MKKDSLISEDQWLVLEQAAYDLVYDKSVFVGGMDETLLVTPSGNVLMRCFWMPSLAGYMMASYDSIARTSSEFQRAMFRISMTNNNLCRYAALLTAPRRVDQNQTFAWSNSILVCMANDPVFIARHQIKYGSEPMRGAAVERILKKHNVLCRPMESGNLSVTSVFPACRPGP
jgi:hypothetical protein